jgi:holo-[acyl-carrier protein] synthase
MRHGIDIEEVKRFALKRGSNLLKTNFTECELDYAFSRSLPAMHLCGLFCAKEAFRKAYGKPILFRDIEIRHTTLSAPILFLKGKRQRCSVSLSHTKEYAVASAIID